MPGTTLVGSALWILFVALGTGGPMPAMNITIGSIIGWFLGTRGSLIGWRLGLGVFGSILLWILMLHVGGIRTGILLLW